VPRAVIDQPRPRKQETSTTAAMLAARSWLFSRGLSPGSLVQWRAEIVLDVVDAPARAVFDERVDTCFRIEIYSHEWAFRFCHGGHSSWIRVTDVPFVHGRDDFKLLGVTPALRDLGSVVRTLEQKHGIRFRRRHAHIHTDLPNAEASIRRWVESL
jgi:hypothetical protein